MPVHHCSKSTRDRFGKILKLWIWVSPLRTSRFRLNKPSNCSKLGVESTWRRRSSNSHMRRSFCHLSKKCNLRYIRAQKRCYLVHPWAAYIPRRQTIKVRERASTTWMRTLAANNPCNEFTIRVRVRLWRDLAANKAQSKSWMLIFLTPVSDLNTIFSQPDK